MNDEGSRFVPGRSRAAAGRVARAAASATVVLPDVAVVVVFAALGKRSHGDQGGIGWYGHVLWPFLAGLGVAAAVTHCYRGGGTAGERRRRVVAAWLLTVGIALVLRSLFEGRPLLSTFVPVATAFIGLGMLGWRSVAHAVRAVRA